MIPVQITSWSIHDCILRLDSCDRIPKIVLSPWQQKHQCMPALHKSRGRLKLRNLACLHWRFSPLNMKWDRDPLTDTNSQMSLCYVFIRCNWICLFAGLLKKLHTNYSETWWLGTNPLIKESRIAIQEQITTYVLRCWIGGMFWPNPPPPDKTIHFTT